MLLFRGKEKKKLEKNGNENEKEDWKIEGFYKFTKVGRSWCL